MRTMRKAAVLMCFALCVAATPAMAACSWVANLATMNFGAYNVFGATAVTATSAGSIRCTGGNFNVTIAATRGGGGAYSPWRLMSGSAQYNIYTDAAMTIIWGDGTGGSVKDGGVINSNTTATVTEYGNVPLSQDLAPGNYTDSLNVTLGYQSTGGGAWTYLSPVVMQVTMTVGTVCRADTFTLAFGAYSPLSAVALPGASTVKVYCTKTTPATFALDNGSNAVGVQKRMVNAGNYLNYTATLAAGSGTSTSSLVPIGGGIALNGSIPAAQDVPAAATAYIDTLQVVVNY
jgi:spore coat protein U-like protein